MNLKLPRLITKHLQISGSWPLSSSNRNWWLSMPLLTELGFSFLVAASYKPCAPLELSLRKGRLRDLDEITIARQRPDRRKACGQDPVAHIPNATRNWNGN